MLRIIVPKGEYFDEASQEFIYKEEQVLQLEHSLVSLSKWESKWCKPFLATNSKTDEETLDYIRCMTITQNVDPKTYLRLSSENIEQINSYIEAPMTATTFHDKEEKKSRMIITSELIYYWMIAFGIPSEYQKWHLNRLLTLIRICEIKNNPQKKQSKKEILESNAALNAMRRKKTGSKG